MKPNERPAPMSDKPRTSGDNPCKFLAERHPAQLLHWLFGVERAEVTPVKTELSRTPTRADSAILLESPNELYHTEFQTTARSHAPLDWRMLDYYVGFCGLFPKLQIRQALVVLHDAGLEIPAGYETDTLSFRYTVVKLWELDPSELLAHDGLISLAVLCRAEHGSERLLETVAERINALPEISERREQLSLARTLAGVRFKALDIYRILQGGNMLEESVVYQDIVQIGWQKGHHEGRHEGLEEGVLLGEQKIINSLLANRLGKLPASIRKQLANLSENQIEELTQAVFSFRSKAELTKWLKARQSSPTT